MSDGEDATISTPNAESVADGTTPEDDAVVTVFTHNGTEWVPERLEPGESTVVYLANGQPAACISADPAPEEDGP